MQKKSKAKVIFDAFTKGADIPKELQEERLRICGGCEFNTKNTTDITAPQKVTKMLGKYNCTKCGCFIKEKTSQAVEECPLTPPKWQKLALETRGKYDLDLINLTMTQSNIFLEDGKFIIDVGNTSEEEHKFDIGLTSKVKDFILMDAKGSCGLCMRTALHDNILKSTIFVRNLPDGAFKKTISVRYKVNDKQKLAILNIRGIKSKK